MKKTLFIFLLSVIAIPFATQAQIKFKPAFGINFAHIKNSEGHLAIDGQTGFSVGLSLAIGKKLYVEPGVFWEKDNYEVKSAEDAFKGVIQGNYNGLKIPLNVGFYLLGDSKAKLGVRVFGGASGKFTLGASSDEIEGIGDIGKDDIKNSIWGVKAGAGVDFLFLFAELGYNWGFGDVFKNYEGNSQTNHFELTFGLKF